VKNGRTEEIQIVNGYMNVLVMIHITVSQSLSVTWYISSEDSVPKIGVSGQIAQGLASNEERIYIHPVEM
jgi:hypothetical protein